MRGVPLRGFRELRVVSLIKIVWETLRGRADELQRDSIGVMGACVEYACGGLVMPLICRDRGGRK